MTGLARCSYDPNTLSFKAGKEEAFEKVWRERESHLDTLPGFVSFALLRGPQHDDYTLYASHTVWASEEHFQAWTRSEAFRAAHKNAGQGEKLYLGHPEFEGFTAIQELLPAEARKHG